MGTSYISMWIKHPWNTSHILYSELVKTLFSVESTNNIKIKITQRRVIGDGCIWEEISLTKARWVIQSMFYQALNAATDGMFKENV